FQGATTVDVLASIVGPQSVGVNGLAIPRAMKAILLRALAKDRNHRYQSAAEFARELNQWLASQPTKRAWPRRAAVAGFVVLAAGAGLALLPRTPSNPA